MPPEMVTHSIWKGSAGQVTMEETVSKADIQTCVWPGVVDHHAGGAHVGAVVELGGKVHSLSDPNLPCREVAMVHTFLRA